ncbi:MAG: PAS domain-containing protein [Hyphomicrobiales bacterium]|nr:PAS domain-containing protein [Hyphomicrobiales bacterium]
MRQKATRELYAYWNAIRKERAAPDRAEIDPAEIRSILSDTFMIESDGESRFPVRLTGSRLNALWLDEMKGRSFVDLWGEDGASVGAALWTVMDGAAPVLIGAAAAPSDHAPVELELLLLPLRHHGRTHARILGSIAAANHPDWLGLIAVERLMLRSMRIMSASQARVELPIYQRSRAAPQRPPQRPHLRLLHGGREPA